MKDHKKRLQFLIPFKSIGTNILFYFSLLIVVTLAIFSMISINYTEETVMDNSIAYTTRLIEQVNRDIDSYIAYMENISYMVVQNEDVQKYLFGVESVAEKAKTYSRIVMQFNTVVETRADISNIGIIGKEDLFIINDGKDSLNKNIALEGVDWYANALNREVNVLASSHVQHVINNNYKWVVTLSRGIENVQSGRKEAVFFIDLNYKLLKDLCENNSLGSDSYVFIMDENGRIIYHPKQQLIYSGLKEEKVEEILARKEQFFVTGEGAASKLYSVSVSDKTGWRVIGVAGLSDLMKNKEETQYLYGVTAVLLLFAAVLISLFLSTAIIRPLKELKNSMKEVEQGHFEKASVMVSTDNEIGSLGNSFNVMTARIKQLMEQNTFEQEEKRKSELKALRSQINPHFLYNTLDSIIWMAEGGRNEEVVLMTSALAKLLRQSISNDNERIPLQKEIEHTRSYLIIQKMRYKDKLEFEIDISPSIMQEEIINLILQPLVENAIYHGIKYKEGKGFISITGRAEGNKLIIKIMDNGAGMDEETLSGILDPSEERDRNGVGVYNVHSRIRLYYGEESGLSFESRIGEGTTVTVTIKREGGGQVHVEKA